MRAAMADPSSPAHEISSISSKSSRPPMAIKATAVRSINDRSPPVAHLKRSAIEPDQRPDPASSQASTPDHTPITHQPSHPASDNPKSTRSTANRHEAWPTHRTGQAASNRCRFNHGQSLVSKWASTIQMECTPHQRLDPAVPPSAFHLLQQATTQ
ncbi:hypothetical protein ACLOJK_018963, partial [Asimina triloba]